MINRLLFHMGIGGTHRNLANNLGKSSSFSQAIHFLFLAIELISARLTMFFSSSPSQLRLVKRLGKKVSSRVMISETFIIILIV